jgi:hypothetical protein
MTSLSQLVPNLLEDLADGALAAWSDITDAPLPVPQLVIHHDGPAPTIDAGDLLIVMATSLTSSFQGSMEDCAVALHVGLAVTITRNVPNLALAGGFADLSEYSTAALGLAADASTLWHGLIGRCQAGTLWSRFAALSCGDTKWRDMRPGVGGGVGWWTLPVTVDALAPLL